MKKYLIILMIGLLAMGMFFVDRYKQIVEVDLEQIEDESYLSIYLEDEQISYIPKKDSGYTLDLTKSSCTNGVELDFDYNNWTIKTNYSNYESTDNTRVKCSLYFTSTYIEPLLNGTDPVLEEPLIPVTISDDGTVRKADLSSEWYDYETKKWANAVILEDSYEYLSQSGKVSGATKEEGYVSFDGVDDYINLGLENYNFGNSITLALRFTLNDLTKQELFNNAEGAGASLFYSGNSVIGFEVYIEELNQYQIIFGPALEEGKTYTAVGTYDGTTLKLYIDGKLVNSSEISGTIRKSTMPFILGANPEQSGNYVSYTNMDVYQAAIYDRAITEEEIEALNDGKIIDSTSLIRYVDFTNKTYETNEIIPEEAIESYFVWIPKYRYQLWDLGNYDSSTTIDSTKVHEIPILFGDYNTSDSVSGECTTPMKSGESGNCQVGDYMTHPAFISIPGTGFWAGKFETGYKGASNSTEANQNINDANKIIIKPNAYSWRGIQTVNAFYSSYNYQRELDSHMMKNTEWGAIAYLSHSAYGIQDSVRINNHSDYMTGYQANNEPTCGYTGINEECNQYCSDNTCNTAYPNSNLASTTGNITGIYDMSGESWEYTMGVLLNEAEEKFAGNRQGSTYESGFQGLYADGTRNTSGMAWPEEKYYDVYRFGSTEDNINRRILGDATGEFGPVGMNALNRSVTSWYADGSYFIVQGYSWFIRGSQSQNGTESGVFAFGTTSYSGGSNSAIGFRLVLTPTKSGL